MPIELSHTQITLQGYCSVEEAEPLFEWLDKNPDGCVDLSGVTHIHTAVLQALMVSPHRLAGLPADEFCTECLSQVQLPTLE
jgi:anti-anti-sigma regulatory factor